MKDKNIIKKISIKIINFWSKIKIIWKNSIKKYINQNNIAIIISFFSLFVAIVSFKNANRQFEINSIQSDSLFKENLKHSKAYSDSIIKQLEKNGIIINKQLYTADEQLKITKQTLENQIYSGRPNISVDDIFLLDTNKIIADEFAPNLLIKIVNSGQRPGHNVIFNWLLIKFTAHITLAKSNLRTKKNREYVNEIGSYSRMTISLLPKIDKIYKTDFYLYFELSYEDVILNKIFKQQYYYHYFKSRDKFDFAGCNLNEKIKIDSILSKLK